MSSDTRPHLTPADLRGSSLPSRRAVQDLAVVVLVVWTSVLVIRTFDVAGALAEWNRAHQQWAIDEVTLISLCTAAALGVFSWRRWRESQRIIARHQALLDRLRISESEVAARDRLIGSVSHELRTPLTGILGYAELLGSDGIDERERREMVHQIIEQGWDLSSIVEDLLTRARVEAGALEVAAVPVSLDAQTAQVLEAWNREDVLGVHFEPRSSARAIGDPARVRQIVRNLVANALKHGGDTITVVTGNRDGIAWLAVTDDGAGIPPEHRDRIFDPYHQVTGDRDPIGGLGLGLAISRELARLMNGDLTYERRDGRSVFELRLPAA